MKTRFHILISLWWLFVLLGLASAVGSLAAERHQRTRGRHGPVLLHPSAIAVSDSGQLFVFTDFGEIRVFNSDGEFLRSWPVETLHGIARLAVDAEGNLNVATIRNAKLYRFNPTGRLVHEEDNAGAFGRFSADSYYRAVGPRGSLYEIRDSALVRVDPDHGETTVVPGPPLYLSLFFGGFSRTFLFVHGMIAAAFGFALAYAGRSRARRAAA